MIKNNNLPNPQPAGRPACSIVIRAYNEEEHIGRLLAGTTKQNIDDIQVILVDSGSTDATSAIAASTSIGKRPIEIVHIRPNEFTFGRSLNLGIRQASADIVVIASAHIYPTYPDWTERLLAPFDDPAVGLVYGKQRGDERTKFSEQQVFAQWFPETTRARQTHPFCNNANAAIRRALWQKRPYDETLTGLEDLEWARWAMEQGHAIVYVPEAEIIHVHNESPRGVYNRYRREAMAFKRIFPQERFTLWDFLRLAGSNIVSDLWHAVFKSSKARTTRQNKLTIDLASIFWFRTMQFWGTYQGYRHSGPVTWQLRKTFYYPRLANQKSEQGSVPPQSARNVEPIQYNE